MPIAKPQYSPRTGEYLPTEEHARVVYQMAAVGCAREEICRAIGITEPTLRKYYREVLDRAGPEANAKVSGRLFKLAMDGDVTAIIWWEKTRQGRSEKVNVHHTSGVSQSIEERLAALEAEPDEDGRPIIDGTAETRITDVPTSDGELVPVAPHRAGEEAA